uniref:Ig-like domain-containing protein n=2 Tax=Felis catus TaxID=9685 RepID=A0ABI7ZPW4_FELCA
MVFCRHMTTRERSSTMSGAQASLSPAAMANTQGRDIFPPSCSIIFLLLKLLSYSLSAKGKADFSVSGPGQPVLAMVGESVKLQCHLSLNISAEDMEVRWYRKEPSPAVHLRKKGRDMPEEQMWQYKGRTTFWTAGLAQDQAVLTIRNVTVFDNGTFHCKFKESTGSAEATLWLRVAGLGSEPRIQVRAGQDEGIRAECTSEGWYPEPQVEWRDFRGQTLPSTTNLTVSPTTGLFAVVSNVIVWDRDVGNLSCSISNPLLQKRMETKSHLPGQVPKNFPSMAWRAVVPVILIVVGLAAAVLWQEPPVFSGNVRGTGIGCSWKKRD